jgi:hypothetical protein
VIFTPATKTPSLPLRKNNFAFDLAKSKAKGVEEDQKEEEVFD